MNRDDGGPAFPAGGAQWNESTHSYDIVPLTGGMTLRDYFAAKAAAAIISGGMADGTKMKATDYGHIANAAYVMADAMLEARK